MCVFLSQEENRRSQTVYVVLAPLKTDSCGLSAVNSHHNHAGCVFVVPGGHHVEGSGRTGMGRVGTAQTWLAQHPPAPRSVPALHQHRSLATASNTPGNKQSHCKGRSGKTTQNHSLPASLQRGNPYISWLGISLSGSEPYTTFPPHQLSSVSSTCRQEELGTALSSLN